MESSLEMLRHAVAGLAYRTSKVLRGTSEEFGAYQPDRTSRTPGELLGHMGDLFDWALSLANGKESWKPGYARPWAQEKERFFASLTAFDERLGSGAPLGCPPERLFQGPVADAYTHIGQIAMLRRMAGIMVRGENYFKAQITIGCVGEDQPDPEMEFY